MKSHNEAKAVEVREEQEAVNKYEAPAVIYEGSIGTRAGTPVPDPTAGDIFSSSSSSIFD